MSATAMKKRPPVGMRRTGYAIAALVNAGLLYLVNVAPGWESLSFLTEDTTKVLGLVNLSLAVGVVVNVVYLVRDPRWLKALGDLVTAVIGLILTVRTLQVFPFDFSGWTVDWTWLVRLILIVGLIGTAVGVVVPIVTLVRVSRNRGR